MSVAGTVECDAVCWLCSSRCFKSSQCLYFYGLLDPEEEDIVLLQNARICAPGNTVSHPRRLVSIAALL